MVDLCWTSVASSCSKISDNGPEKKFKMATWANLSRSFCVVLLFVIPTCCLFRVSTSSVLWLLLFVEAIAVGVVVVVGVVVNVSSSTRVFKFEFYDRR